MIQRGLLTLVCVAPLAAFGGAYRWFTLPLLVLASLVLVTNLPRAVRTGRHHRLLDAALLASCACIALQLLPLPASLADALSPSATRVRGALRLDASWLEAWRPLSIDPAATMHALGVAGSAAAAFFAARGLFSHGGLRRWCRTLTWVGLVVALFAVAQRALSPTLIYGMWAPREPNAQPFGPFINRNHFAGWLLMAGCVVAGYAVVHARMHVAGRDQIAPMLRAALTAGTQIYVSAALVMAITVVSTLSRSALLGLVAGAVTAVLASRRHVGGTVLTRASLATAAVILGVVIASAFVDASRVAARIGETMRSAPDSRLVIWQASVPLVRDFWLTGVGAGAYGSAMLLYEGADSPVHFNQAHSHYVQLIAEGGMLLGLPWLLAALLFIADARDALEQDRSEVFVLRVAALCGMTAIAVQSLWETPLRMGANAVLFAVLAGIVLHRPTRPDAQRFPVTARPSQRTAPPMVRRRCAPASPSGPRTR